MQHGAQGRHPVSRACLPRSIAAAGQAPGAGPAPPELRAPASSASGPGPARDGGRRAATRGRRAASPQWLREGDTQRLHRHARDMHTHAHTPAHAKPYPAPALLPGPGVTAGRGSVGGSHGVHAKGSGRRGGGAQDGIYPKGCRFEAETEEGGTEADRQENQTRAALSRNTLPKKRQKLGHSSLWKAMGLQMAEVAFESRIQSSNQKHEAQERTMQGSGR